MIFNNPFNTNKKEERIEEVKELLFCISTAGNRIEKTSLTVKSIERTCRNQNISYKIVISGNCDSFRDLNVNFVDAKFESQAGLLAKMRNMAASSTGFGDTIVFIDDDIIFPEDWCEKLLKYSKKYSWDVLGNKILLPNGDRYWDRATFYPVHTMVDYKTQSRDGLYQTGCFWVIRREVYNENRWDDSLEVYAEKNGRLNEDLDLSLRLTQKGFGLDFDESNMVWHWDDSYREIMGNPHLCIRVDQLEKNNINIPFIQLGQFEKFISNLREN